MVAYFDDKSDDPEIGHKSALAAIKNLDGTTLCGKELYVKQFQSKADREKESVKDSIKLANTKCTLFVKNLDSRSIKQDIEDLFGNYGTLESVHLVNKPKNKQCYCIIQFQFPKEAKDAKNNL